MDTIITRDCNTCTFHYQGGHPDSVCQPCLDDHSYLPFWKHKENKMSDGATEMLREEREGDITITNPDFPKTPLRITPLTTQVGGDHYTSMRIQPLEFAIANSLDFFQKDIIKYVTRRKGGKSKRIEDLKKAQHYLSMYIDAVEGGSW